MKLSEVKDHLHRISHLSSDVNYTFIHFIDSPSILYSRTLSYCLAELPGLIRIHRKYAVNPECARLIRVDSSRTEIAINDEQLPVSRRLAKSVRYALTNRQRLIDIKSPDLASTD